MAIVTGDRYLELLAGFIDRHAENLLEGTLVLKLNPVGLLYLQSRLASLKELEELRIDAPVDYLRAYVADLGDYRKLEKLRRFLLLLESVKVVSLTNGRDSSPISFLPFGRLRVLELRGCDLSTCSPRGLLELRPHLEKIVCINSANALRHIFLEGSVDEPPVPWVCLTTVHCPKNSFTFMDEGLRVLPAVQSLDLSSNALTKAANLEQCTSLRLLDLGFNHISAVDSIGPNLSSLRELVLRGNALASTRGLEDLMALEKLDLGHNVLSSLQEVARLQSLPCLLHLWLDANPLAYLRHYRAQVLSHLAEPFKVVLDGKRITGCEQLAVKKLLRALQKESRKRAVECSNSHSSQSSACKTAGTTPVLAVPLLFGMQPEQERCQRSSQTQSLEGQISKHAEGSFSAPVAQGNNLTLRSDVSLAAAWVSSDAGVPNQHGFLRSLSNSDDEIGSSERSDESDPQDGSLTNQRRRPRRRLRTPPNCSWLAEASQKRPAGTDRALTCSVTRQRRTPFAPFNGILSQSERSQEHPVAKQRGAPLESGAAEPQRPFLHSTPGNSLEREPHEEEELGFEFESLDSSNLSELLRCRSAPIWTPPQYQHGLLDLRADLEAELLQVASSAHLKTPLSAESSTDSSSVEWSESDSDPSRSGPCSLNTKAGTVIGRLIADLQARRRPGGAELRTTVTEPQRISPSRRRFWEDMAEESRDEEASSGELGQGFIMAGRWQLGQQPARSAMVPELEPGAAMWRQPRRPLEFSPDQEGMLQVRGTGPTSPAYSDDAMATAGGGSQDTRRLMRRVKWGGRSVTAKDETALDGERPPRRFPSLGRGSTGEGVFSQRSQGRGTFSVRRGKPAVGSELGSRHRTAIDSPRGRNLNRDTMSRRGEAEDEVEVCFRRTVGDQKTRERSLGYLRCGCLRVWKGEREESPKTVLFSSDAKWYILHEEISQSALTHRQGLVLRVLASHKVTDVKRIVVSLGLQVLRVHAGAAAEYVIVTRSSGRTADLLQRLAPPTDPAGLDGSRRLGVESWGSVQVQCMERELFGGGKPNIRLYAMLHHRYDTGGRWLAASLILTARSLVLCQEQLCRFAASLVTSSGVDADADAERDAYFRLQTRRDIRDLRKLLPSRRDPRHLSLVFLAASTEATIDPTEETNRPGAESKRHGASQKSVPPGGSGQRGERQELTVWELRFPTEAILQQILPLLKATWAECKEHTCEAAL